MKRNLFRRALVIILVTFLAIQCKNSWDKLRHETYVPVETTRTQNLMKYPSMTLCGQTNNAIDSLAEANENLEGLNDTVLNLFFGVEISYGMCPKEDFS